MLDASIPDFTNPDALYFNMIQYDVIRKI